MGLNGEINNDLTLDTSFPVYVTSLDVIGNHTLTIQPGVIMKFENNGYSMLRVNGTLNALGTEANPVVFTSILDDSYGGDTNQDGSASQPYPGSWKYLGNIMYQAAQLNFDHVIARFGGSPTIGMIYAYDNSDQNVFLSVNHSVIENSGSSGIYLDDYNGGSSLSVSNSTIRNNNSTGIFAYYGIVSATLEGNTFANNVYAGAYVRSPSTTITQNTFSDSQFGLRVEGGDLVLTQNSFINNTSKAANLSLNGQFTFSGNTSSGPARIMGLNGEINNDLTLDTSFPVYVTSLDVIGNHTLTIQPGVIMKFENNGYSMLRVNGTLNALGTEANPVVFTSILDDSYGGDTNQDGSASQPYPGSWKYLGNIMYQAAQLNFDHVIARFGGSPTIGMIYAYDNSDQNIFLSVKNSVIEYSGSSGIYLDDYNGGSSLSVSNSTIRNNNSTGIFAYYGIVSVTLEGNTFANNVYAGAYVRSPSTTITQNTFSDSQFGLRVEGGDLVLTQNSFINNTSKAANLSLNGQFTFSGNTSSGPARIMGLNGEINNDLTLDTSFPVYVTSLDVIGNHTLTIQPGVIMKFENNGYSMLRVNGTLNALGTEANPVVFTSILDDSYGGDTNQDGSASQPYPGSWNYIGNIMYQAAQLNFDHVIARFGGSPSIGMIYAYEYYEQNTFISVKNSVIENSFSSGIYIDDQDPANYSLLSVEGTVFRHNTTGIVLNNYVIATARYNTFSNNSGYGILNQTQFVIDSRYSYWGADNGPAPYGSGNAINTFQIYEPACLCTITIPAVTFSPWKNTSGELVGLPPVYYYGFSSSPNTAWMSDPVNAIFGNYIHQQTDLSIPTLGENLSFQRNYNSASTDSGPLGIGWVHNFQVSAHLTDQNTVTVQREDGRKDLYAHKPDGSYLSPAGIYDNLALVGDHFKLTRTDQTVYSFNPDGTLASITDRNGNALQLAYSGQNLSSITDPAGRQLLFTYNGSLLAQITDPLGRKVNFNYVNGLLISATDVSGATTNYSYDSSNRLELITDANGHRFVQNTYNTSGQVVQQTDALDNLTTFIYNADQRRTINIDPRGNSTTYNYDLAYRITSEVDSLGNSTHYSFDANNNRSTETDRNGNTTWYTYDNHGNILSTVDAYSAITTYTYDGQNNLLSNTDANGHASVYTYDSFGNRLTSTDAIGRIVSFAYYNDSSRKGRLQSATDPRGYTTSYDYNPQGDLVQVTDALGNEIHFIYDLGGRKLTFIDARLNTWSYTYDNLNRLLIETDPLGGTTIYTYDPVGNKLSLEDANHNLTSYTYDARDRLISSTNALGYTTTTAYDPVGNQTYVEDGNSHTTVFAYDSINRLTVSTDPLGHATTYGYDKNGNRISVTDPLGHTTTTDYDRLNRPVKVTDALGHFSTTTYDLVGNVLTVTDANGHTTTYTYDALRHLLKETDAKGGKVSYAYDETGNRISHTDANNHTTTINYDELNRLVSICNPLGYTVSYTYDANSNQVGSTDENGHSTTFSFDDLNRLVGQTSPTGVITGITFDAVGNRTHRSDGNGKATNFNYDAFNQLTSVIDPLGNAWNFSYDAVGNRTSIEDPNHHITTYIFDDANRLVSVNDPMSHITTYTYNAANQKTSQTDPNGQLTSYIFDAAGQLSQIQFPDHTETLTYDAVGNRLQMADVTGNTLYSYNELNWLTDLVYPGGDTVDFTYDPKGNLIGLTYPDSSQVNYTYDAADRLVSLTDWSSLVQSYTYDPVGNLTTVNRPNDTASAYTYDNDNRLLTLTHTSTLDGTLNSFAYTYNGAGNRLTITTPDGVDIFTYDDNGRLASADYATGEPSFVQYNYDPAGNRATAAETINGTPRMTAYIYDAGDHLTQTDQAGTLMTYAWDNNGNQLSNGVWINTWNAANRLISTTNGASTYSYTYNGDGWRTSGNENGIAASYRCFTLGGLPQVLSETHAGQTTRNLYGLDLVASEDTTAGRTYLYADGMKSTSNLSDAAGHNVASYRYDAFGTTRQQTGSTSTDFLFDGQQKDENGLYFMRARYYDPATGRFLSHDPQAGSPEIPSTLHGYIFAANNPLSLSDPSGESYEEWKNNMVGFWSGVGNQVKPAVEMFSGDETAKLAIQFMKEDIQSGALFKRLPDVLKSASEAIDIPKGMREIGNDGFTTSDYYARNGDYARAALYRDLSKLTYAGSIAMEMLPGYKYISKTKKILKITEMTVGYWTGTRTTQEALIELGLIGVNEIIDNAIDASIASPCKNNSQACNQLREAILGRMPKAVLFKKAADFGIDLTGYILNYLFVPRNGNVPFSGGGNGGGGGGSWGVPPGQSK